ncbi:hypothetical protein BVZ87_00612 [Haemophilus influenzae]|nr:hypothetical protein BVZ87_00612 [Haemophilus influenzae]
MIFKLPLLVILPSFAAPFFTSIMEVPLLVKVPVMFRLSLVSPLNLAPSLTVRLPVISAFEPIKLKFPSVDMLPRVRVLSLSNLEPPLWACNVTFAPLLILIFPVILLLEFSPPRVTLPPKIVRL